MATNASTYWAAAAPNDFKNNSTDTSVEGIPIDAKTIPELQALMDANQLKSVGLTQFYLNRISHLNRILNAVIAISPRKEMRLSRAVRYWLARNPWAVNMTLRCDAVFVARRRLPRHVPDVATLAID